MTQMLSQLSAREVSELRGFLERCVAGLESAERGEAAGAGTGARAREAIRPGS
jgi:hypothetical protein